MKYITTNSNLSWIYVYKTMNGVDIKHPQLLITIAEILDRILYKLKSKKNFFTP